jgi:hypothetical protein
MDARDTYQIEVLGVLKSGATWADAVALLWRAGEQILADVRESERSVDRVLGAGLEGAADECYTGDVQLERLPAVSWGRVAIRRFPGVRGAAPARRMRDYKDLTGRTDD